MEKGGNDMYRRWVTGVSLISVLLCASGTAVYAMPEASVENNFETGIVDISLHEYMLNESGRRRNGLIRKPCFRACRYPRSRELQTRGTAVMCA